MIEIIVIIYIYIAGLFLSLLITIFDGKSYLWRKIFWPITLISLIFGLPYLFLKWLDEKYD